MQIFYGEDCLVNNSQLSTDSVTQKPNIRLLDDTGKNYAVLLYYVPLNYKFNQYIHWVYHINQGEIINYQPPINQGMYVFLLIEFTNNNYKNLNRNNLKSVKLMDLGKKVDKIVFYISGFPALPRSLQEYIILNYVDIQSIDAVFYMYPKIKNSKLLLEIVKEKLTEDQYILSKLTDDKITQIISYYGYYGTGGGEWYDGYEKLVGEHTRISNQEDLIKLAKKNYSYMFKKVFKSCREDINYKILFDTAIMSGSTDIIFILLPYIDVSYIGYILDIESHTAHIYLLIKADNLVYEWISVWIKIMDISKIKLYLQCDDISLDFWSLLEYLNRYKMSSDSYLDYSIRKTLYKVPSEERINNFSITLRKDINIKMDKLNRLIESGIYL
jgi:hypothetical protein